MSPTNLPESNMAVLKTRTPVLAKKPRLTRRTWPCHHQAWRCRTQPGSTPVPWRCHAGAMAAPMAAGRVQTATWQAEGPTILARWREVWTQLGQRRQRRPARPAPLAWPRLLPFTPWLHHLLRGECRLRPFFFLLQFSQTSAYLSSPSAVLTSTC